MEISEALEFVRSNHNAVLSTVRTDGTPQLSPVTVGADDGGHVLISTRLTALKVKNLQRDPQAWLCVFTQRFYGDWIQLTGETQVVTLPEAMPLLEEYYRDISGEHPDWDDYRAAMIRDQRCILRITPSAVGPTVSG